MDHKNGTNMIIVGKSLGPNKLPNRLIMFGIQCAAVQLDLALFGFTLGIALGFKYVFGYVNGYVCTSNKFGKDVLVILIHHHQK